MGETCDSTYRGSLRCVKEPNHVIRVHLGEHTYLHTNNAGVLETRTAEFWWMDSQADGAQNG